MMSSEEYSESNSYSYSYSYSYSESEDEYVDEAPRLKQKLSSSLQRDNFPQQPPQQQQQNAAPVTQLSSAQNERIEQAALISNAVASTFMILQKQMMQNQQLYPDNLQPQLPNVAALTQSPIVQAPAVVEASFVQPVEEQIERVDEVPLIPKISQKKMKNPVNSKDINELRDYISFLERDKEEQKLVFDAKLKEKDFFFEQKIKQLNKQVEDVNQKLLDQMAKLEDREETINIMKSQLKRFGVDEPPPKQVSRKQKEDIIQTNLPELQPKQSTQYDIVYGKDEDKEDLSGSQIIKNRKQQMGSSLTFNQQDNSTYQRRTQDLPPKLSQAFEAAKESVQNQQDLFDQQQRTIQSNANKMNQSNVMGAAVYQMPKRSDLSVEVSKPKQQFGQTQNTNEQVRNNPSTQSTISLGQYNSSDTYKRQQTHELKQVVIQPKVQEVPTPQVISDNVPLLTQQQDQYQPQHPPQVAVTQSYPGAPSFDEYLRMKAREAAEAEMKRKYGENVLNEISQSPQQLPIQQSQQQPSQTFAPNQSISNPQYQQQYQQDFQNSYAQNQFPQQPQQMLQQPQQPQQYYQQSQQNMNQYQPQQQQQWQPPSQQPVQLQQAQQPQQRPEEAPPANYEAMDNKNQNLSSAAFGRLLTLDRNDPRFKMYQMLQSQYQVVQDQLQQFKDEMNQIENQKALKIKKLENRMRFEFLEGRVKELGGEGAKLRIRLKDFTEFQE